LVRVPLAHFAWTRGTPTTFKSSAIVDRGFCKICGTPLFLQEEDDTDIEIAIGTFDNPNAIGPMSRQVGVESRLSWFGKMHELPSETTEQNRKPEDLAKLKTLQHPDHDTDRWSPKSA
jgi:hypothetical protein